jgi:hypothetical protein
MFLLPSHQERALALLASSLCSVEIGGGMAANGRGCALFDCTPSASPALVAPIFTNGPEVKA